LDLNLLDHVRGAVDLDDHPALEVFGWDHGRSSSWLELFQHNG
jgi:hypothetical protein